MMEVGMSKLIEDFLSNHWNIYGLQVLCGSLMVMVLHNYLSIAGMLAMGICVYLIAMCQRILGIRYGMIFYEANENRISRVVDKIKKMNKKKDKRK